MEENRYYRRDAGGLVRRRGPFFEYLDKQGNWIEDGKLLDMFIGGDTNFDEISAEQARKLVEDRGEKFTVDNFDYRQMIKDLLLQWLDNIGLQSDKHKTTLFDFGCQCLHDVGSLYDLNRAIVTRQDVLTHMNGNLSLNFKKDSCTLVYDNEKLEFNLHMLKKIITGMIDILEPILPLGTVVDLNQKYLQKHIRVTESSNLRIMITHRFLYQQEDKTYFPYAGVVYPLGMFDHKQVIHFTPALIDKVVHLGFSDQQDEAYIYLMKRELILEKAMHSFGFASENERQKFQLRMEAGVSKCDN